MLPVAVVVLVCMAEAGQVVTAVSGVTAAVLLPRWAVAGEAVTAVVAVVAVMAATGVRVGADDRRRDCVASARSTGAIAKSW